MALDFVELDNIQAGDDVAVDTIAANMYQLIKVGYGAVGSFTPVDGTNPLPVTLGTTAVGDTETAEAIGSAIGATALGLKILAEDSSGNAQILTLDATGALKVGDGGQSLTVDGAVTCNAGTNLNTAALALEAGNLATIAGAVAGTEMQVDVVSSALPTGAATSANQATANASLGSIATDASTLAGAVALGQVQTDVVSSALPTGAATSSNQTTANAALAAIQTAVQILDNVVAGTEAQVDVVAPLPAGTNNIGDVDIASALPAGSNTIGSVSPVSKTTGGATPYYTNVGTLANVKASAGQIYTINAVNLTTAPVYLQVFNLAAASVTLGTTAPTQQFAIPSSGDTNGAGFVLSIPVGLAFGTAISMAITTTAGGSTTTTAGQVLLNVSYA